MSLTNDDLVVRRLVVVDAPIERAFKVFTEQFGDFKPKEHNLLGSPLVETRFEPRVGGHIYDVAEDGSECRWARVLAFEPPDRVVFSWDISPYWQLEADEANASEVEVRFIAETSDRTRLELEHRNLDRHGPGWEGVRDGVAGDAGWPLYLARYAEVVAGVGLMAPVIASIDVDRSAAEVFAYVTDPTRFAEWQKGVVDGHMDGQATPTVGDRCQTTRRIGFSERPSTSTLVTYEPPHRWSVRGIDGPIRAAVDVTVEPKTDEQSHLTISVDFEGHGIGRLLVPTVVRREAEKEMPANVAALKQRMEATG